MRLADEIQELFEEAMREVDRLSLNAVRAAAFGVGHWLAGLWPRMPCEGWQDELDWLLREYARNHLFITDQSRADIIAWVTAANEKAKQNALVPGGGPPRRVRICYGPRPQPAALRTAHDKPAPLDPDHPALRRVGHIIMEQFPPADWLRLGTNSLKRHSVPEEIAKQFLGWLEAEQRKAPQNLRAAGDRPAEVAAVPPADEQQSSPPSTIAAEPEPQPLPIGPPEFRGPGGGIHFYGDQPGAAGPPPLTEDKALTILAAEVKRWRGNGWNFAANLLQYFLDKKGPQPYTPTAADIAEIRVESQMMVQQAIYRAIWDNAEIRSGNLDGAKFMFSGNVRWTASGPGESIPGSVYGTVWPTDAELVDANDDLFYAFGGATMTVDGTVTRVGTVLTPVKSYLRFDARATVTIRDNYTFPPGEHDVRLLIRAYDAAHFLERRLAGEKYKAFPVTVEFDTIYNTLRSDKIAGGAFHRDRPFRPGEAVPPPD